MNIEYSVPKDKVFLSTEIGMHESLIETFLVHGDLSIQVDSFHRPILVFTSFLLPGNASIFMMVKVACYIATEYSVIVQFEVNGHEYWVYPHQKKEDILLLYRHNLCIQSYSAMVERLNEIEKTLQDQEGRMSE